MQAPIAPPKMTARHLSARGVVLRPCFTQAGVPNHIPDDERPYDPAIDTHTRRPRALGFVFDRVAFSRWLGQPAAIDMQIKAAQSDLYFLPDEIAHHAPWIQNVIDHHHRHTASAFTRAAYVIVRQNIESVAPYWHYDIGNPSRSYVVSDTRTTRYADRMKIKLDNATRRAFEAARGTIAQNEIRNYLLQATDFAAPRHCHKNGIKIIRHDPYDIVAHDHLSLHCGPAAHKKRTSVTIAYVDSDQPGLYNFGDLTNPMMPGLQQHRSAAPEEAFERYQNYLKPLPPKFRAA